MKLERANKDIVKGYRRTKVLKVLDDFIESDMDCAKVVISVNAETIVERFRT